MIVKPVAGEQGRGICVLDWSGDDFDADALFKKLREENIILEEIVTSGVLSEFNPSSVNTIRLVTLAASNKTDVIFAVLKMGSSKDTVTDNFGAGGIAAVIDVDSGIVATPGVNKRKDSFLNHPVSGKQIVGYRTPGWHDIVGTVMAASRVVPEVRYVGWDVTINAEGEVVLIEGNDNSGYGFQAIDQVGLRKVFRT